MVKLITHLEAFWSRDVKPLALLGKSIEDLAGKVPFKDKNVRVTACDEREFSFQETPDEIHHFETLFGDVLLYAIKSGKIIAIEHRSASDEVKRKNKKFLRRWLRKLFPEIVPPAKLEFKSGITDFNFLVPLNEAHLIMDVFNVDRENKSYQRWRRDDGLRHSDLIDVLQKSGKLLFVDWREWLGDAVIQIQKQLLIYDVELKADLHESEPEGQISVDGCSESICFNPSQNDCDFEPVVASINKIAAGHVEYRRLRYCEGQDEYDYALLSEKEWQTLEESLPELTDKLFAAAGSPYRY